MHRTWMYGELHIKTLALSHNTLRTCDILAWKGSSVNEDWPCFMQGWGQFLTPKQSRAGEMAQLAQLLHKHEGQSWEPSCSWEMPGTVAHSCKPSAGGWMWGSRKTLTLIDLSAQWALHQSQVSKAKAEAVKENTQHQHLASAHKCMHTHKCACTHTHTLTQQIKLNK